MKEIRLYGDMGDRFGKVFHLAVATPAEAIRALCVIRPGFRAYLQERLDAPFRVLVDFMPLNETGLTAPVGCGEVIRIVPMVAGAKDGLGQALLGAAILATVFFTGGMAGAGFSMIGTSWMSTAAIGIGTSMVLGGVSQLLAKAPESPGASISNNDAETWAFGSPTLTTGQGGCVPLGYGTMRIGGHVISGGIDAQTWQDKGFGGAAPDNVGTRGGNGVTSPWVWAIAET